jgi:hypothetical protein
MTTSNQRLEQTTEVDEADDVTVRLVELMTGDKDIASIVGQIAQGADLHVECSEYETVDETEWTGLTPMSLAVLLDAEQHRVLLTPLFLNHGGDIRQVDSKGRTLTSFAVSGPVAAYLKDNGAADEPWLAEASGALSADAVALGPVDDEPLIPEAEWETLVPAWLKDQMDAVGYFNPAGVNVPPSYRGGFPLVARFSAARLLGDAVLARDAGRVGRLIELGGHTVDLRHDYDVERAGVEYYFKDLTTLGLAVLIDGEAGLDDSTGEPEGEPCVVPLFAPVSEFLGEHDHDGNTLLHIAKAPRIAAWLVRLGLPLDAVNNGGLVPVAVAPPMVKVVLEQALYEAGLPLADGNDDAGRRRRL